MTTGLFLILMLAPFVVVFVADHVGSWRRPARSAPDAPRGDAPPADLAGTALVHDSSAPALAAADAAWCEAESLLVSGLMSREIDRESYRAGMAELAARDARSRPLQVPREPAG